MHASGALFSRCDRPSGAPPARYSLPRARHHHGRHPTNATRGDHHKHDTDGNLLCMVTGATRVFAARLAGTAVFAPNGDQLGVVRDIVCVLREPPRFPRVIGLVVEVGSRRRIFMPMTRVTDIEPGAVVTTGRVNLRHFAQRESETLVLAELLDRRGTLAATGEDVKVLDAAMEWTNQEWDITRLHVRKGRARFRRSQTLGVEWPDVTGLVTAESDQAADTLLESVAEMHPADVAVLIRDLPAKRRIELARGLTDERLADVIEEMGDTGRVEILTGLDAERAADVLEQMAPDDAADVLAELSPEAAAALLELVEPDEAEDLRRLLIYDDRTAGGMMNPEPIILPADATVAQALASVRNPELPPSLAAQVYVVRPPMETPTGRLLGVAHFQRLLREPPAALVTSVLDKSLQPIGPDAPLSEVTRNFATYNLVALPVVDGARHLLGVVTVDDVIDHMLPEDWRERPVESVPEPRPDSDTHSPLDSADFESVEVTDGA